MVLLFGGLLFYLLLTAFKAHLWPSQFLWRVPLPFLNCALATHESFIHIEVRIELLILDRDSNGLMPHRTWSFIYAVKASFSTYSTYDLFASLPISASLNVISSLSINLNVGDNIMLRANFRALVTDCLCAGDFLLRVTLSRPFHSIHHHCVMEHR